MVSSILHPLRQKKTVNERVSQSDEEKSFISDGGRDRDAASTPCEERQAGYSSPVTGGQPGSEDSKFGAVEA